MKFSLLTLFGLLIATRATPHVSGFRGTHTIHEKREFLPQNWSKSAKMPPDFVIPLRIALAQSNLDQAEELLMDVSHPESPNYGKHWTIKQVAKTFAPTEEACDSVKKWLNENGINSTEVTQSLSLAWIRVNITIADAERLLKTTYHMYTHDSGIRQVRCMNYSLPHNVRKHIDFITPTVHFDIKVPAPKKKFADKRLETRVVDSGTTSQPNAPHASVIPIGGPNVSTPTNSSTCNTQAIGGLNVSTSTNLSACGTQIVPDCLRALYGIPENNAASLAPGNSLGVDEYSPYSYVPCDLDLFLTRFSPSTPNKSPIIVRIDGGVILPDPEDIYIGEPNLDLQWTMGLVGPQEVTLFQVGDPTPTGYGTFNNFLDAFDASYCADTVNHDTGDDPLWDEGVWPNLSGEPYAYTGPETCGGILPTKVISTSYGNNEDDIYLTPAYATRQCNEYMKFGLLGITFIFPTQDGGVRGNDGTCTDPITGNFTARNPTYGRFRPAFPAGCPWVTAVGATILTNGSITAPEQAANFSGGGFSDVFGLPEYQKEAVKFYYDNFDPGYNSSQYNNSRQVRGIPDIAAHGYDFVSVFNGVFDTIGGTSASVTVIASIMTLINQSRLNAGKSPVGFINPVLYSNREIMNDIVLGHNRGCGTEGFSAVKGWDPVTGYGTPNFPAMEKLWLSLP